MPTVSVQIAREYLLNRAIGEAVSDKKRALEAYNIARAEKNPAGALALADAEAIKVLLDEQHRLNRAIGEAVSDKKRAVEAYNALRDRRKKGSHRGNAKRNKPRAKGSHAPAAAAASRPTVHARKHGDR
jgi:hypothetical protein